jgi:hypothetical protein
MDGGEDMSVLDATEQSLRFGISSGHHLRSCIACSATGDGPLD